MGVGTCGVPNVCGHCGAATKAESYAVTRRGVVRACSTEHFVAIQRSSDACTLGELEDIEKKRRELS